MSRKLVKKYFEDSTSHSVKNCKTESQVATIEHAHASPPGQCDFFVSFSAIEQFAEGNPF